MVCGGFAGHPEAVEVREAIAGTALHDHARPVLDGAGGCNRLVPPERESLRRGDVEGVAAQEDASLRRLGFDEPMGALGRCCLATHGSYEPRHIDGDVGGRKQRFFHVSFNYLGAKIRRNVRKYNKVAYN